jgi:RHH-type proline utilization regulon transcriptional repressor/proline dehydrogenase/delta 1-pyrroline-5-carboxylate dehydrogenase
LHRLLRAGPAPRLNGARVATKGEALRAFSAWTGAGAGGLLDTVEREQLANYLKHYAETSPLGLDMELPGPVGEDNRLSFLPRGRALGIADTVFDALHQFAAALAAGNRFILAEADGLTPLKQSLPPNLQANFEFTGDWPAAHFDAVLLSDEEKLDQTLRALADRPGPIVQIVCGTPEFALFRLIKEKTVSINTAAAGGNASLMTLGR